jgi:translation initiation factor IF-3
MKVAKNLVFKIEIEIIEIHAILKLKYSKQSKFKSNWPHISVIEIAIEIEIHFKIEITLYDTRIRLKAVLSFIECGSHGARLNGIH